MKLHKVRFLKTGTNKYSMKWGTSYRDITLSADSLKRFLKKISASDVETLPKSIRKMSYTGMANKIASGEQSCIWAPDHKIKNLPDFVKEAMEKNMKESVNVIKSLAKKSGKSEKEVEKLWKEAVKIAEESFGKKEKDFDDREFRYVTGILKKMLKINEGTELVKNFLNSDKPAKDFVKEAVQGSDSFGINTTIINKDKDDDDDDDDDKKKKPKVVDPAKKKEEVKTQQEDGTAALKVGDKKEKEEE